MSVENYFFIHGAWHGAWCFETFVPILKNTKHCNVYTPDRPRTMNLEAYVNVLRDQILALKSSVILVGHSLGGVIVSQLAERIPDQVKEIIYIAAYVPENLHSMLDEVNASQVPGKLNDDLVMCDDTITLKKTENVRRVLYTNSDDKLAAECIERLTPDLMPLFFEAVKLTENRFGRIPKKYICCLQDKAVHPSDQQRMYQRLTNCTVINLEADHTPFLSMPEALAALL